VTGTLVFGLAAIAALACPLHMWWAHRRGRHAACCSRAQAHGRRTESLEQLRARRAEVEAQLAEFSVDAGSRSEAEHSRS
jgi:uncharacterized iron-regulated membrane protein